MGHRRVRVTTMWHDMWLQPPVEITQVGHPGRCRSFQTPGDLSCARRCDRRSRDQLALLCLSWKDEEQGTKQGTVTTGGAAGGSQLCVSRTQPQAPAGCWRGPRDVQQMNFPKGNTAQDML